MKQYEHIQNKLKQYAVDIDKDKLWANTSHAIPQKRRRRGFILFFSGLALLVAGGLFFLLSTKNNTAMPSNPQQGTDQAAIRSIPNHPANRNEMNPAETNTASASTATSNTSSPTTTTPTVLNTHNTQNFNTSKTQQKASDLNTSRKAIKYDKNATGNLPNPSAPEKIGRLDAASANGGINSDLPVTLSTAEKGSSDGSNTYSYEDKNIQTLASNWSTQPVDPLLIESLEETERLTDITVSPAGIERAKKSFPLGIAFMQGAGFSTLDIETLSAEAVEIANTLSAQTKSLEQIYTSLHAITPLGNTFQLSTGLQYSRLTTELNQTTSVSEDYITEGITSIIIGEDGQVENLYGNVNVHREVYTSSTRYTYQHKLDLELMVHANIIRSPRWSAGLWAKGSYNLMYASEGTTLDTEGQLLPYTSSENPFHLKSPFGFGAGLNTTYNITPSWAILGRMGYERLVYTHGVYDDQLIYKHNILNLGLGIRLSL